MQKDNNNEGKNITIEIYKAKKEDRDTRKAFEHVGKIDREKKREVLH